MASKGYGLVGDSGVLASIFQARLSRTNTTTITLDRYNGSSCVVNGEDIDPGSGGIACVTTDNLISSTGTDSAGAMGASTLYYIYLSNTSASFAPSDVRGSATAPSSYNGVKYLATSGNGANWRFVGYVRTNASTNFVDDTTDRLVVNFYNRQVKSLFLNPGYADANSATTYTNATADDWVAVNGGTGATGSWIANGENAIKADTFMVLSNGTLASKTRMGLGIDDTSAASKIHTSGGAAVAGERFCISGSYCAVETEGYHTITMLTTVDSGTATIIADSGRMSGEGADARTTSLWATVMV